MSNPSIEFIYDFGSPNAYLVHVVVPAIEAQLNTKVIYSPALLGGIFKSTGNVSPAVSLAGVKNKGEYMNLETQRFVRKWGLESSYASNPHFPVNTLLMMRIATAVRNDAEVYPRVLDCFFDAMWKDAKKMDDPALVASSLNEAGLPADDLIAMASADENKKTLIALTDEAVNRGVFGAPSFLVGDELFFGKDKLPEVEEEFRRQQGE